MKMPLWFSCIFFPALFLIIGGLLAPSSAIGMIVYGVLSIVFSFNIVFPLIVGAAFAYVLWSKKNGTTLWYDEDERYTTKNSQTKTSLRDWTCLIAAGAALSVFTMWASTAVGVWMMIAVIILFTLEYSDGFYTRITTKWMAGAAALFVTCAILGSLSNQIGNEEIFSLHDERLFTEAYVAGASAHLRAEADERLSLRLDASVGPKNRALKTWLFTDYALAKPITTYRGQEFHPSAVGVYGLNPFVCTAGLASYPYEMGDSFSNLDEVLVSRFCLLNAEAHG